MRLYNQNLARQSRRSGVDEAEEPTGAHAGDKQPRRGGDKHPQPPPKQEREDDGDYHSTARSFYETPSQGSVVVETVFRRPQPFANLHELDGVPEIDRVPTAVGFHSMDSAEEITQARSTCSRYELEEIEDPPAPEPEESLFSVEQEETSMNRDEPEEEDEVDQATIDDDLRYGPHVGGDAPGEYLKSAHSDDSETCPPEWRSEDDEEVHDQAWRLAEAKRIKALNAVRVPQKMLRDFEKSQITRQAPISNDDKKSSEAGKKKKLSVVGRRLRQLIGGSSTSSQKKKQTALASEHKHAKPSKSIGGHSRPKQMAEQKKTTSTHELDDEKSKHSNKSGSRHSLGSRHSGSAPSKKSNQSNQSINRRPDPESKREKSATPEPKTVTRPVRNKAVQAISSSSGMEVEGSGFVSLKDINRDSKKPIDDSKKTTDELIMEVRDQSAPVPRRSNPSSDDFDEDEESTNVEIRAPRGQGKAILPPQKKSSGNMFTDWIVNGLDALANIGYNQPPFGVLDWSGEEKIMAELEAASNEKAPAPSGKKMPVKTKMTKRLLTKEDIKARLIEERNRKHQQQRRMHQNDERIRGRSEEDLHDIPYISSQNTPGSVEVKNLTLDFGEGKGESREPTEAKRGRGHRAVNVPTSTIEIPTPSLLSPASEVDDASILGLEKSKARHQQVGKARQPTSNSKTSKKPPGSKTGRNASTAGQRQRP